MVRQRLIQDFQIVTNDVALKAGFRPKDAKQYFHLSMGHRVQQITYDPNGFRVEAWSRTLAVNKDKDKLEYNFELWLPASQTYTTSQQSFDKYPDLYRWNVLDSLICGQSDEYNTQDHR